MLMQPLKYMLITEMANNAEHYLCVCSRTFAKMAFIYTLWLGKLHCSQAK